MKRLAVRGVVPSIVVAALLPVTVVAMAPDAVADARPAVSVSAEAISAGAALADVTLSAEVSPAAAQVVSASAPVGDDEYWFDDAVLTPGSLVLIYQCGDQEVKINWRSRSARVSA